MSGCKRFLLASLISAACNQAAWAEGLLEVYRQAVISDPQLQAAAAQRLATLEIRPQARALLLPEIGVAVQRGRDFNVDQEIAFDPDIGVAPADASAFDTRTINVNLIQPIFRQGALVQLRQADSIVNQAEADFLAAQQILILQVAERYFGVLSAQDDLTFREADREATERQLEQARRRFEVGLITITDVHEAQARFDLTTAEEITARNRLSDSLEALREITGRHYEELHILSEPIPLVLPQPADPDAWIDQAMAANPQVLSAGFGVETARENINLQQAGHFPTLDLVASYNDADIDNRGSSRNSIGLRLNIPIYQGGAVVSRTREATHLYEAARQNLETQQRLVTRQIRDSYRGAEAAISRVNAFDQAQISTQSALEATEAGFDVGTRTIVEVLDAQREVFRSQRDYAQSRYDYILNLLRLRQAAGQVNEADVEQIDQWLQPPR